MPDIVPGVDFRGGLTVRGAELQGKGSEGEPAILEFRRQDTVQVRCESQLFILKARQFSGIGVRSVIRLGEDSIVHPELTLRFNLASQNLALIRTEEGLGPQPFKDSYHSLVLDCDVLAWKMNENRIRLEGPPGASRSRAILFSEDFFDEDVYRDMQGIDPVHPLVRVYQHVRDTQDSTFTSRELAASLRLSEEKTRMLMIRLAHLGYLDMDLRERVATATGKLFDDLGNAAGRRDHDVLYFLSETVGGQNGEINLLNRLLKLDGVSRVDVSRDRGVIIEPRNGRVVVAEDRDRVGRWSKEPEFDGSDYVLITRAFPSSWCSRACNSRSTMKKSWMFAGPRSGAQPAGEHSGGPGGRGDQSAGWSATGIRNTRCPGRSSPAGLLDTPDEQGLGARPVPPWWSPTLDSLDALGARNWCSMATLESATCPPLTESLRVMDDLHLGFQTATPVGGYQVYGGAGVFDQNLTLDGGGLQGGGTLDFLTAHAESDRFVLLPDSTKGVAQTFTNRESAGPPPVPEVQGEGVNVLFEPRKNRMAAASNDVPIRFFEGERTRWAACPGRVRDDRIGPNAVQRSGIGFRSV